ncbi:hypothetical protein AB0M48_44020 [Lentzea sp. NPDC051208]|uniref:hypothetical protein n=1 Tax=Lentzea sp. NPDC051208 TaxID=3154642 RepID=UPI003430135F
MTPEVTAAEVVPRTHAVKGHGFLGVPGIGVEPIPETVRRFTTAAKVLYAKD